jgi:glycosyltransferase involved in cell wall biosynthesis
MKSESINIMPGKITEVKRPLVAVGLPTFDDVKADFALSLAMMVAATHNVQFAFNHSKATWVAHARNLIVEGAIDMGAEWLLFLDSDMTFPRETLQRLMSWNKDIVCASYVKKKPPYHTVGSLASRPTDRVGDTAMVSANGLYEMEKIGLGVCLIKMSVFKKMQKPWFHYEYKPGSNVMTGEDILWCHEVRKLGFKVWIDAALSMHVGHIGNYVFRPEQAYPLFDIETGQRKQDADIVQEQMQKVAASG